MQAQHQVKRTLRAPQALARVRALLAEPEVVHRSALAKRLCAEFGFFDARGRAQYASCMKALRELEHSGHFELPAAQTCSMRKRAPRRTVAVALPHAVPSRLEHVQGLELVLVQSPEQRALWEALLSHEHPRGAGPLVGCQLRYLVGSAHGWLGAFGFGASALNLAARERWIGWDIEQRRAHLHRVVGLNRFLIRPTVHCHNLASHLLGRVLRVLGTDFERRYGYRPWLVESFIDEAAHSGVSYRAANWIAVGHTCGRGRQDRRRAYAEPVKAIYLYLLDAQFRAHLGIAPSHGADAPLAPYEGLDSRGWAEQEFGHAALGDKRLTRRLVDSVRLQAEQPMRAFTGVAKGDWAATKGYYRLIDQPDDSAVTPHNILAPHRQRTIQRMGAQATVLCVQDGTDLDFTKHAQCTGLGLTGSNQTGAHSHGLHLHSTLAVSTEGLPLGVVRAQFDAPQKKVKGQPSSDKTSTRWLEGLRDCAALAAQLPDTRVVTVMDREADFFELFDTQRHHTPQVQLLVRAQYNRKIATERKLFEALRQSPERARLQVQIGRQSARPKASKQKLKAARAERTAEVVVHYERVVLTPSDAAQRAQPPLELWGIHLQELTPPQNVKALEWWLLTTVPVTSPELAKQMITWYGLRWRIEDWHRVLKTGCRVEQLGHDTAQRLARAMTIRAVIAWRIMLMTLLGREVAELPAQLLFSELELTVLSAFARSRNLPHPTELGEAVRMVARLGGYLARNHDPPPGHQLMWHGYTHLTGMCAGYALRQTEDE